MTRNFLIGLTVIMLILATFATVSYYRYNEPLMTDTPYQSNRLFGSEFDPNYDRSILKLARRIESKEIIGPNDVDWLDERLNQRHGDGITLLFHALATGNVSAADALLSVGADPYMTDVPIGSVRNLPYMLQLPGGRILSMDELNGLLRSYLANGGDPNATWGDRGKSQGNLPEGLASSKNLDGLRLVLEFGGDPWKPTFGNGERRSNAMTSLATFHQYIMLDELIDAGYFNDRPQEELQSFLVSLGGYAQRGDDISLEIQRIAKRILKRNPNYTETSTRDEATRRIFKNHWKNELPGTIPWDEILSDAVE